MQRDLDDKKRDAGDFVPKPRESQVTSVKDVPVDPRFDEVQFHRETVERQLPRPSLSSDLDGEAPFTMVWLSTGALRGRCDGFRRECNVLGAGAL
jgi:hypothetical protein